MRKDEPIILELEESESEKPVTAEEKLVMAERAERVRRRVMLNQVQSHKRIANDLPLEEMNESDLQSIGAHADLVAARHRFDALRSELLSGTVSMQVAFKIAALYKAMFILNGGQVYDLQKSYDSLCDTLFRHTRSNKRPYIELDQLPPDQRGEVEDYIWQLIGD